MVEPAAHDGEETQDSVCGGALVLAQRRDGYRFNHDSVLLARFASEAGVAASSRVLELGLGNGVVALLLARWRPRWQVSGIEIQPALADRARRNASRNGLPLEVLEGDYRTVPASVLAGDRHLVVVNPPYHPPGEGRTSPDPERAGAKQELHARVEDALRTAKRVVRSDGRVCVVYPAPGLARLAAACDANGFVVVRWRFVHPSAEAPAHAVLLEAAPGSRRVAVVERPLVLAASDGRETDEGRRWVRDPAPL